MGIKLELLRGHVDLKKSASVGLVADVIGKLVEELAKINERISTLEKRIDATAGAMRYAGDWIEGFEYSDGDVVLYGDSMFVAVQPSKPASPPSRYTGWAKLPMEA